MTFTEFAVDVGSNIIGELIGGTFGEKLTDYLLGRAADFLNKRRSYKKFIGKGEDSRQELEAFFQALNDEINEKRAAVDKKTYKKAKTAEKRAEIMLSEFCLYTGISQSGIESELSAYEAYRNLEDDDLKQAIVDVLLAMRKYYSESKLSDDNQALLSLLCSEDVTEILAKKIVARFAGRVSLVSGGEPVVSNGAGMVVKGLTLTKLECPNCGAGILQELRSSNDKTFECANCGAQFSIGDFSDDFKTKINNNLAQANDYLATIYAEIKSIESAIVAQGKEFKEIAAKTVEETFEKTKRLIEANRGISKEELSEKLSESTAEIIEGVVSAFTTELEELKSNQVEQINYINKILNLLDSVSRNTSTIVVNVNNLIRETESEYPSAEQIGFWANGIKSITSKNYIANFCYDAVAAGSSCKRLYARYITSASPDDVNEYGSHVARLLIRTPKYFDESKLCAYVQKLNDDTERGSLLQALDEAGRKNNDPTIYNINARRHIFVVYAHEDIDKAKSLVNFLEKEKNLKCFYAARNLNNGLGSGDNYAVDLMTAIDNCECVVFISTKNSRRLDHDTIYNLDKKFPKGCEYTGNWGELRYIEEKFKRHNQSMPRIEYRPDEVESGDEEADKFVAKFFEGTGRYCNSFEMVYERFKNLIINGEWEQRQKGSKINLPEPSKPEDEQQNTEKIYAEADFNGQKVCKKCYSLNRTNSKFCTSCRNNKFYETFEEYNTKYCKNCLEPNARRDKFCGACGGQEFITKEECDEEISKRKKQEQINSLITIGDEAFNQKDYKTAVNLYSQAATLGSEDAKNKITLAEKAVEDERKRLDKINFLIQKAEEAHNQKDYDNAIALYVQAITLGSNEAKDKKIKVTAEKRREEKRKEKDEYIEALLSIGDYKDDGKGYVLFGTYPQSLKANDVSIVGSRKYDMKRGYYLGSDNCLYAKNNSKYYKVEPIRWQVLSQGDELFLVAEQIIDRQRFDNIDNNYADSTIRDWLNDKFYNTAFNEEQKRMIIKTIVDNSLLSTGANSNSNICEDTNDKIFLLSHKEVEQYLKYNPSKGIRRAYSKKRGSEYSKDCNLRVYSNGCSPWWLRSPGVDYLGYDMRGVDFNGKFIYYNICSKCYAKVVGIVPALRINVNFDVKVDENRQQEFFEEAIINKGSDDKKKTKEFKIKKGVLIKFMGKGGDVVIPDDVTSIYDSAFYYRYSIKSITIPDSVTSIGDHAFHGCKSLINIIIPNSVTSIGKEAFYGCTSLESVTVGNGVTSIGYEAFKDCTSLTSITIGSGVTSIGSYAFYNTAYYNDTNNWENNMLYIGNYLIAAKTSISGSYTIKDGTMVIATSAFHNCTALESITIPDSVTSIGSEAFYGCSKFTSIIIPDGVTSIGSYAFRGCKALTNIIIPNSITFIGWWAFYDCTALIKIYCEAESQPKGWDEHWHYGCKAEIVWGYSDKQ